MSTGRSIAAACLATLAMCALPAAAQLCGQACAGNGVLQFNAPDQGQFGFARARSMTAPPNLLQVDRPHFGSTSHNPDFTNSIRIRVNSPQEGGQGEDYSIDFILPNNAVPTPGAYTATRYPFNPTTEAGFDFSGTGQGCNTSESTFTIHEVVLGAGTSVTSLALDFTHHCGTGSSAGPTTTGQLRFNSSWPIGGGGGGGPGGPRVTNLSTRGLVMAGHDAMIGGFVIGGTTNKTVAIIGTGPSLAAYGIANPLSNPVLTLIRPSDNAVIATNDNWQDAPNPLALEWNNYDPPHPSESAMLVSLAPGAYTAILSSANGIPGVGLVAVYEAAQPDNPLVNLSTRGQVREGNEVMISGFVIPPGGPKTVSIVATGPSLAAYGVTNPLSNPTITLVRASDQAVIATNDDWGSDASAGQLQAAGFAPPDPLESGLRITLQPGAYTVILSGVGGATGVGVLGIYAPN
jgi:hypothetical protein